MRISFVYGVAAGAGLLLTMQTAQAAEKVKWAKSFSAAMADAKKTNRLVMADFYTEW